MCVGHTKSLRSWLGRESWSYLHQWQDSLNNMWHFKKNLRSYLEIHFITLASNFALYYFQITFSSFKLVIWHSRLSKLCLSLDFKSIFLNKFNKKFVLFCNMNMASWLAGRSTIDWRRRREYKIDSITSVKTSYIYTCNMSLTCNYGLFDNICSPSWVAESLRVPSHGGVISIGRKIVTSKSQNLSTIFCYIQFPNHFLNTMLKISSNFDWNIWVYWIISENQTCDHLCVKFRMRNSAISKTFDSWFISLFKIKVTVKIRRYVF